MYFGFSGIFFLWCFEESDLKCFLSIGWYGFFMCILNFDNDNGFVLVYLKFKVFKVFYDILFLFWKILRYLGVKEFIEYLCLVFY